MVGEPKSPFAGITEKHIDDVDQIVAEMRAKGKIWRETEREEMETKHREIIARYEKEVEEIRKKHANSNYRGWMSPEMQAILDDSEELGEIFRARRKQTITDFFEAMDGISKASKIGQMDTIKRLQESSFLSSDRLKDVYLSPLITDEEMNDLGLPETYSPMRVEAVMTNMTIDLLDLDQYSLSEMEKVRLARWVWGREVIIDKLLAQAKEEQAMNISKGLVGEQMDFLIYSYFSMCGIKPEQVRDKVTSISAAFSTPLGRQEFMKMAVSWDQERQKPIET